MENVEAWLYRTTQSEALPRGVSDDLIAVKRLDAQADAEERIREMVKRGVAAKPPPQQKAPEAQTAPETAAAAPAAAEGDAAERGRGLQEEGEAESAGECAALGAGLSDATFESVVMDKAKDVFVLFYRHSAAFCAGNGTAYAAFAEGLAAMPSVLAAHMNVRAHKSPFVFEEGELPVAMLFPAEDKRPLEFDQELTPELLHAFVREHGVTLRAKEAPKGEL